MIFLAETDISSVPAEFVKYFLIMMMFAGGLYLAHRKGMQASGTKAEPVNIAQPLEVKQQAQYAHRADVEHMKKEVQRIMEAGDERRVEIIEAINESERRTLVELRELHQRLNPVAEACKAHAAVLQQIEHRLNNHERLRQEEMQRIHQRVDDAIRLSSGKTKS